MTGVRSTGPGRAWRGLGRTLVLGLALAPSACSRPADDPAAPASRPDLLVISIDTLRADHLGCYGYGRDTSPFIDALAATGVRFERCWSPTSWTLPAHLSLLTGLATSVHGIDEDRHYRRAANTGVDAPLAGVFLSEVLAENGYRSAGFFRWQYLRATYGFGPGFETWEEFGPARLRQEGLTLEQIAPRLDDPFDQDAVDAALAWAAGAAGDDRPLGLFVHLFDPHDGYRPPAPFDAAFTDPDYDGPIDGRAIVDPPSLVEMHMPEADMAQVIALYDGEIAWVDSQVARLVEGLRALSDDLLIVLTSDHGEEFFEHRDKGHRKSVWRESTHVPLIVHWDGHLEPRVVPGDVGTIDIAPTLYGLLRIDPPGALSGRDLTAVVRGESDNADTPYASHVIRFHDRRHFTHRLALRHGDELWHRTIEPDGRSWWAHLSRTDDPLERTSGVALADGDPRLERGLELLADLRAEYAAQRAAQPLRGVDGHILSDEDIEQLARLGYADPSSMDAQDATAATDELLPIDGGLWEALRRRVESASDD